MSSDSHIFLYIFHLSVYIVFDLFPKHVFTFITFDYGVIEGSYMFLFHVLTFAVAR